MKRVVNFTSLEDVQQQARQQHLKLVVFKGVVYDLTEFIYDHPGGHAAIKPFINQNIDDVIFNPVYHRHSAMIILTLEKYRYGLMQKDEASTPQQNSRNNSVIGKTRKFLVTDAENTQKMSSLKLINNQEDETVNDEYGSNIKVPVLDYHMHFFHSQKMLGNSKLY